MVSSYNAKVAYVLTMIMAGMVTASARISSLLSSSEDEKESLTHFSNWSGLVFAFMFLGTGVIDIAASYYKSEEINPRSNHRILGAREDAHIYQARGRVSTQCSY